MTDFLVKDTGLNNLTREAKPEFEFDNLTELLETRAYLRFCIQNDLLTTDGEQSRKALIQKVFAFLNGIIPPDAGTSSEFTDEFTDEFSGSGGLEYVDNTVENTSEFTNEFTDEFGVPAPPPPDVEPTSEDQMIAWLQMKTGLLLTDKYDLWLAYFDQHRTQPDNAGVTYSNLSVEAGYRKFLNEHMELSSNFYDNVVITDKVTLKLKKVFGDTVSVSDLAKIFVNIAGYYSDTVTASDSVVLTVKKNFADALSISDSVQVTQVKSFSDSIFVLDNYQLNVPALIYSFIDNLSVNDRLHGLITRKAFTDDPITMLDVLNHIEVKRFNFDTIDITDNTSLLMFNNRRGDDTVDIQEVVLVLQVKKFNDSIDLNDSADMGYAGCGAGYFGAYFNGV